MSDMNWRDKDDLDLTADDIDAMAAEGQPVAIRGPRLPGNAVFLSSVATSTPATTLRPEVGRPVGQLLSPARTHAAL